MSDPYQAIVRDGNVTDVIVCDQAAAEALRPFNVFPGATWHDVTDLPVRPAPGWTWREDREPQFQPLAQVEPDPVVEPAPDTGDVDTPPDTEK